TPGAPNILRNVFVEADSASVDEDGGTASFTIHRTGDLSAEIAVGYQTINGTAVAGVDYEAATGVLTFAPGEDAKQIVVNLISDDVAEGFEAFSLSLTSADSPFLITNDLATVVVNDANVSVAKFQQGVNSYAGTTDTYLDASQPNFFFGFAENIIVDDQVGEGEASDPAGADVRPLQGLLRFEDLFGSGVDQVPAGAQIFGGFLTVKVLNPSAQDANVQLVRILQDWDDLGTWTDPQGSSGSSILNGIVPDGVEAATVVESIVTTPGKAGLVEIPLGRETLQAWSNGTLDNYGWMFVSDSADSWIIASSEDGSLNPFAPELTILYTDPSGAGTLEFAAAEQSVNEGDVATVTVQRVGGSTGPLSVDYAIAPGTGSSGDVSGAMTGSLSFADGELFKTFNVSTVQDIEQEANETFTLTLTGAAISASGTTATLSIRDNDIVTTNPPVLMSEVLYNQPGNDGGAELIELTGTPGAGLGSLYAVVVGGDLGEDEGATNLVVDLGAYTNGTNGHTLIGSKNNFVFDVPEGATFIGLEELDVEFIGGNDNGTSTYALVYSPLTPLFVGRYDYDWDNDGGLELPAGAVIVDSIAVRDNSSTDSTYGGSSNTITTNPTEAFDAVTRRPGTTGRNNASNWYAGDLLGSNDALVYNPAFTTGLPSTGAAITPGAANTGDASQSPLVTLQSVATDSGVQVTFSGPVSQVLAGDGSFDGDIGAGISVTNLDGTPIAGVDAQPQIVGLGSETLTLKFTGPQTVSGQLPAGSYALHFVGNSLVGNGRAVDAAGSGSSSNASQNITVAGSTISADFDGNGFVDGLDFLAWQQGFGSSAATRAGGDADGDNQVGQNDFDVWASDFGTTTSSTETATVASADLAAIAGASSSEATSVGAFDEAFASLGRGSVRRTHGFRSFAV
ncbi:MAG: hypothetical protein KDA61_06035, partial [Planctomycetales bacterium]|nr:hypothetical protein [Planctomycetales bacterium]